MPQTTLSDKRIVVTGGHGFLGRHIVRELRAVGCRRVVPLGGTRQGVDLTDASQVAHVYRTCRPDMVIHAAARVGGIQANESRPGQFIRDNLAMGCNVIDAARRWGVEKFVLIGTVCSYPAECPVPFRERDLFGGYPEVTNAPYGIAKRALMSMLAAYREQYGLAGVTLLPANMYGPGDNVDMGTSHVIPGLVRRVRDARQRRLAEVRPWGSGAETRDFLYVGDAARAIRLALEFYDDAEPVNVGTGVETSVADLLAIICDAMDYNVTATWQPSRLAGQSRRCLDVTSAAERFTFRAEVPIAEGIRRSLGYYDPQ